MTVPGTRLACFTLCLLALAPQHVHAFTCSDSSVSIGELRTTVSDEDEMVYVTGFVDSDCPDAVAVTVTLSGKDAEDKTLSSGSFTIQNVPAGGASFDLTNPVQYNEDVQEYEVSKLTVRPVGPVRGRVAGRPIAQQAPPASLLSSVLPSLGP